MDEEAIISAEWTNSFKLPAPSGFTNVQRASFSYWSMDGGAAVYLTLAEGDELSASKFLRELELNGVVVFENSRQTADSNSSAHASWYHPERYRPYYTFGGEAQKGRDKYLLSGHIAATSSNSLLFIKLSKFPR